MKETAKPQTISELLAEGVRKFQEDPTQGASELFQAASRIMNEKPVTVEMLEEFEQHINRKLYTLENKITHDFEVKLIKVNLQKKKHWWDS